MKFEDCYPPEIVEWAQGLPEPEYSTPAQKRIATILDDAEVIRASKRVFEKMDNTSNPDEAVQRLDSFIALVEDIAALPDQKPRAARWYNEKEKYAEFPTKKEVSEALEDVSLSAQDLAKLLNRHAALIHFDSLEELQQLLGDFLKTAQMTNPFDKSLPNPGMMAAEGNWRNYLLKKIANMSEVRLGERHTDFIQEVHRVLLNLETPMDASTVRYTLGNRSKLAHV